MSAITSAHSLHILWDFFVAWFRHRLARFASLLVRLAASHPLQY
uniref:Uncharacterized protein n=1 Tax=Anguilla anguilla TaxID=7936 RepID=A0A0E9STG8_ANGAN